MVECVMCSMSCETFQVIGSRLDPLLSRMPIVLNMSLPMTANSCIYGWIWKIVPSSLHMYSYKGPHIITHTGNIFGSFIFIEFHQNMVASDLHFCF